MLKSNFNAIEGPVTVSSHKLQRRMKRTVRGLMIRTNADTGKSERRESTRPRKRNGQMKFLLPNIGISICPKNPISVGANGQLMLHLRLCIPQNMKPRNACYELDIS